MICPVTPEYFFCLRVNDVRYLPASASLSSTTLTSPARGRCLCCRRLTRPGPPATGSPAPRTRSAPSSSRSCSSTERASRRTSRVPRLRMTRRRWGRLRVFNLMQVVCVTVCFGLVTSGYLAAQRSEICFRYCFTSFSCGASCPQNSPFTNILSLADGAAFPADGGPRPPPVPAARGGAALSAGASRAGAGAGAALRARAGPVPGAVHGRPGRRAQGSVQGLCRERAAVLQVGGRRLVKGEEDGE